MATPQNASNEARAAAAADPITARLDDLIRAAVRTRRAWTQLRRLHPSFNDERDFHETVADALLNPLAMLQVIHRKIADTPALVAKRAAEMKQEANSSH